MKPKCSVKCQNQVRSFKVSNKSKCFGLTGCFLYSGMPNVFTSVRLDGFSTNSTLNRWLVKTIKTNMWVKRVVLRIIHIMMDKFHSCTFNLTWAAFMAQLTSAKCFVGQNQVKSLKSDEMIKRFRAEICKKQFLLFVWIDGNEKWDPSSLEQSWLKSFQTQRQSVRWEEVKGRSLSCFCSSNFHQVSSRGVWGGTVTGNDPSCGVCQRSESTQSSLTTWTTHQMCLSATLLTS